MVFPFRAEVIAALEAMRPHTTDWKPRYYLALGYWHRGRLREAATIFDALGQLPRFAPFYAARATFPGLTVDAQLADLTRAAELDPAEWRYGKLLAERLLLAGDGVSAAATTSRYVARFPASYILGLTHARALLAAGRHGEANTLLDTLKILPYEGSGEGHALFREAKLLVALDAMRERRWDEADRLIAAARTWPERLGAGRPYDADVDERLESLLAADVAARRSGGGAPGAASIDRARALASGSGVEARVVARWLQLDH